MMNKELSKNEYKLLKKYVGSVYQIENTSEDSSSFKAVEPQDLFVKIM